MSEINPYTFGREASAEEMSSALEGYFNSFDAPHKGKELAAAISGRFHRTLIQYFGSFVIVLIRALANTYVDGRNESSNKAMRKLEAFIDESDIKERFQCV